ncbi:MAG: sigma-70 family RNA polymerase sigma factor [Bacteroidaceae bacterium]|nr:sigma-70 family RNA polymerase sigma factor [Bacteroidaceae bacterium]
MTHWTDIDMVMAVQRHDNVALERCYRDCKSYFTAHAGAFFVAEAHIDDIFQESMIHLWREIETHRIELQNGCLCRWKEGELQPLSCSLRTFLLAIAKRKHWEQLRKQSPEVLTDDVALLEHERYGAQTHEDTDVQEMRERVVTDAVLAMSERCRQILTLFYYEHRSLDEILVLRPENTSKIGLKTSKYKCMQRLRETVKAQFSRLHLPL